MENILPVCLSLISMNLRKNKMIEEKIEDTATPNTKESIRESIEKKIDSLVSRHPTVYVLEALASSIAKNLFYRSHSHLNLIMDLKVVCELITNTVSSNEERICADNPKIKVVVLVEGSDGLYHAV